MAVKPTCSALSTNGAFDSCHENLVAWLEAWQDLETGADRPSAAAIRSAM